jgi:predicted DNA-binding protein
MIIIFIPNKIFSKWLKVKLPKELRERDDLSATTSKVKNCSIKECKEIAIRSLAENKWKSYVEKAQLKYIENKQHKIYLCKLHYKDANKYRKSQEKMYQKKGFLEDTVASAKGKRWD